MQKRFALGGLVGCLRVIAVIGLFVGGIFYAISSLFASSDVYQQALAKARSNPQVSLEIGEPIQAGWFTMGSISTFGLSGDADLQIPISGPRNGGMLFASARRSNGVWQYYTLAVQVNGSNRIIELR